MQSFDYPFLCSRYHILTVTRIIISVKIVIELMLFTFESIIPICDLNMESVLVLAPYFGNLSLTHVVLGKKFLYIDVGL